MDNDYTWTYLFSKNVDDLGSSAATWAYPALIIDIDLRIVSTCTYPLFESPQDINAYSFKNTKRKGEE